MFYVGEKIYINKTLKWDEDPWEMEGVSGD